MDGGDGDGAVSGAFGQRTSPSCWPARKSRASSRSSTRGFHRERTTSCLRARSRKSGPSSSRSRRARTSPTPSVSSAAWNASRASRRTKDWYEHPATGFIFYERTPASGRFTFTVRVDRTSPISNNSRLEWVVGYVDDNNYVKCGLDQKNFYRTVKRNGVVTPQVRPHNISFRNVTAIHLDIQVGDSLVVARVPARHCRRVGHVGRMEARRAVLPRRAVLTRPVRLLRRGRQDARDLRTSSTTRAFAEAQPAHRACARKNQNVPCTVTRVVVSPLENVPPEK